MPIATPFVGKGYLVIPITGQVAHSNDAAGSIGYILNPEGVAIVIDKCVVYVATQSSGACNLTIGVAADVATAHDRTDLFPATAMGAATGKVYNGIPYHAAGDELTAMICPQPGVIAAFASASSAGLVARAIIHYIIL